MTIATDGEQRRYGRRSGTRPIGGCHGELVRNGPHQTGSATRRHAGHDGSRDRVRRRLRRRQRRSARVVDPGTTTASSTPTPTPTPSATDAPATPADTPTATPPAWASTSVEVSRTPPGQVTLAALRSAHNEENGESFDRLVLEFTGGLPGYRAGYVNQVVQDGSGAPVPLRGQAFFEIVVHPAAAHDDNGAESLVGPRSGGGLPALVEYDLTSDFEGYVQVGVGLDDVVGFRVFELAGPDRLVFDFAS